jgi:hypothetical protein
LKVERKNIGNLKAHLGVISTIYANKNLRRQLRPQPQVAGMLVERTRNLYKQILAVNPFLPKEPTLLGLLNF